MKSKDQRLLEEAYTNVITNQNQIIDEGAWSQLKGLGKGMVSGGLTGLQNVAAGAAKAVGVKVDDTNRQTMGQSFAKAQQGSMFKGFQTSTEKTVNDFINDAKKMGVDLNDPNIVKQFPEAATTYKQVQDLLKYIKNPTTPPAPVAPPTAAPSTPPPVTGKKPLSMKPADVKKRADRAAAKQKASSSAPVAPAPTAPKPLGFNNSRVPDTRS